MRTKNIQRKSELPAPRSYRQPAKPAERPRRPLVVLHRRLDALAHALSYIEARKDLLALMRTCRTLYRAGTPALLGHPLVLDEESVWLFHRYLVANGTECIWALRDLDLRLELARDAVYGPLSATIALILRHAENLKRLRGSSELLNLAPSITNTVCSLEALTMLDLVLTENTYTHEVNFEAVINMLLCLRGPLASLTVASGIENPQYGRCNTKNAALGVTRECDLFPTLARFSSTLERVNLCSLATTSFLELQVYYPRLTHLDVRLSHLPLLSTLVTCFPQLEVLNLTCPEVKTSEDVFLDTHAENVKFQQEQGLVTWSMVALTGDAAALCVLALQCRVPTVKMSRVYDALHEDWVLLGETLTMLSPTDVSLSGLDEIPTEYMPRLLCGLCWLTKLDLTVSEEPAGLFSRMKQFFDQLMIMTPATPLLWTISLTFNWRVDPRSKVDMTAPNPYMPLDLFGQSENPGFIWDPWALTETFTALAFGSLPHLQVCACAEDYWGLDECWYRPSPDDPSRFGRVDQDVRALLLEQYQKQVSPPIVKMLREFCWICGSTPCVCGFINIDAFAS